MSKSKAQFKLSKRQFLKSLLSAPLVASGSHVLGASTNENVILGQDSDHFRICFGSCNYQYNSQSHWNVIGAQNPDLWIWLGDNIYGDTRNMNTLESKYNAFKNSEYGKFIKKVPVEGIWDDHDYGENNADRTYPFKKESQGLLLDFFGVDKEDPRREREGIYYSKTYFNGLIKVYYLDCRYFREEESGSRREFLGEAQWQWLEEEIQSSQAEINIFASSIGVLLNRLFLTEDWAEYPTEKKRLMDLVGDNKVSGAFFLSGDKHFGAMVNRKFSRGSGRTRYHEFQSSGLTHVTSERNLNLVSRLYGKKNVVTERNFGQMDFYQNSEGLQMTWTLHGLEGGQKLTRIFKMDKNSSDKVWERA